MAGVQGAASLPSSELLERAFRHAFNSILITDADFSNGGPHILAANPAFCRMTGYTEDELIGRSPRILQGPETDRAVIERLSSALRTGDYFFGSTVNYRKDGTPYTVEWNITAVTEGDQIVGYVSMQQDISARAAAEREHALLIALGHLLPAPMLISDANHRITFANAAFELETGYSSAELVGRLPTVLYPPETANEDFASAVAQLSVGAELQRRITLRRKDGSDLYVDQRVIRLGSGHLAGHLSTFNDISDLVQSEAQWRRMAHRDTLTGALNRRGADALLKHLQQEVDRTGAALAVMFCDIDHFKLVNDTYRHDAGDRVLTMVANALQRTLREGDLLARYGGEEFLIAVPGLPEPRALALAERLRAEVAAVRDQEVPGITISIGVALGEAGEQLPALLARADAALYSAKNGGRDRVVLSHSQ